MGKTAFWRATSWKAGSHWDGQTSPRTSGFHPPARFKAPRNAGCPTRPNVKRPFLITRRLSGKQFCRPSLNEMRTTRQTNNVCSSSAADRFLCRSSSMIRGLFGSDHKISGAPQNRARRPASQTKPRPSPRPAFSPPPRTVLTSRQ